MGLVAVVARVAPERVDAATDAATVTRRSRGLFGRERLRSSFDPTVFDQELFGDGYDHDRIADLDKAWHAIHVTLCGETDDAPMPAGFLLGGHAPGPPGAFLDESVAIHPPDAVRAVAGVLRELPLDAFLERLDVEDLARRDVYPSIWERDPVEDTHEYVGWAYGRLREVVLAAAEAGDALHVSIG